MNKNIIIAIVALAIIVAGAHYFSKKNVQPVVTADGYKNASYSIDGHSVTLVQGYAEEEAAPGSASKIVTQYFGNEAHGDLNGDGKEDIAFLLTQSGAGSGTFYYAVVALNNGDDTYTGTNAVLLGDRIAPQTTEIHGAQLVVNYADRAPGEPMTAQPSVGVSKYLKLNGTELVPVK